MRLWSIGPSDSDKIAKQLFLYRRENLLVCFSFHRVVSRVQIQFIFRLAHGICTAQATHIHEIEPHAKLRLINNNTYI